MKRGKGRPSQFLHLPLASTFVIGIFLFLSEFASAQATEFEANCPPYVSQFCESVNRQRNQLIIFDEIERYSAGEKLSYLEDPNQDLTISDVLSLNEDAFKRNDSNILSLGQSESAYWIKLDLIYQGEKPSSQFILDLDVPLLDQAILYVAKEGKPIQSTITGYHIPQNKRWFPHPSLNFPVSLQRHNKTTFYLRVESQFSLRLPITLLTEKGFSETLSSRSFFEGLFIGGVLIMLVYHFLLFVSSREKVYLLFILYGTMVFITSVGQRMFGLHLFETIPDFLNRDILPVYNWTQWILFTSIARHFITSKHPGSTLDNTLKIFIRVFAVSLLVACVAPTSWNVIWSVATVPVILLVFTGIFIITAFKKIDGFGLFLVAWVVFLTLGSMYTLVLNGHLPFNAFTSNTIEMGLLIMLLLISQALTRQFRAAKELTLRSNSASIRHLDKYRALFNNAEEGIFTISEEGQFIDANPAMLKQFGFENVEALRLAGDAFEICFPVEKERDLVLSQLTTGQDIIHFESQYDLGSDETKWAQTSIRLVNKKEGRSFHYEGSITDISASIHKEELLKEKQQEKIRTEVAKTSSAAKSEFLANMSHEIRTPLTSIIGYGEALQDQSLDSKEMENYSQTIVRSGHHLLNVINDILDQSKIDNNQLDIEITSVELPSLLHEIKANFEPRAKQKNIAFTLDYRFPLPTTIQSDATRLNQILINLCGNALKFTEKGTVSLIVRFIKESNQLEIAVKDSGIGLTDEQASNLFQAYTQAATDTTRKFGGTGLGLSISKKFAELLGGTIRVNSTYGVGSEFIVTVSTGDIQDTALVYEEEKFKVLEGSQQTHEEPQLTGKVLLAEDNLINQKLISMLVRKTGAEVNVVENGEQALKEVASNHFDLVLMDIQMPVMDGVEAVKQIRKRGITVPIIACTANVMSEDVEEYLETGCNACIKKPIDRQLFYEVLSHYLENDVAIQ